MWYKILLATFFLFCHSSKNANAQVDYPNYEFILTIEEVSLHQAIISIKDNNVHIIYPDGFINITNEGNESDEYIYHARQFQVLSDSTISIKYYFAGTDYSAINLNHTTILIEINPSKCDYLSIHKVFFTHSHSKTQIRYGITNLACDYKDRREEVERSKQRN